MSTRRNHDAAFKARVAFEALKGVRTVSELATPYSVHPTMIHQWKKSLLEGAVGIFECGGKAAAAEVAQDTVHDLHAKIGELAVANDFFVSKARTPSGGIHRSASKAPSPSSERPGKCAKRSPPKPGKSRLPRRPRTGHASCCTRFRLCGNHCPIALDKT